VLGSSPLFALLRCAVILIQVVLLNVVDDWDRNEIANTHLTAQEEPNLGTADVVLNELLDDMNVVLPGLQAGQGFIDISTTAFNDERLEMKLDKRP
jgi:hypothetical protein